MYGGLELQDCQEKGNQRYGGVGKAAQTKNPLLLSFGAEFATIVTVERIQSGMLDDLPLSIADGDFESNQSRGDRARHGVRLSRLGDDASLAVSV